MPTEAHVILASTADLPIALEKSSSAIRIAVSSYEELQKTLYPPHQAYHHAAQSAAPAAPASHGSPVPPPTEAVAPGNDDRGIVKLRGLPWECRTQDIINFFSGLQLIPDGIRTLRFFILCFFCRWSNSDWLCFFQICSWEEMVDFMEMLMLNFNRRQTPRRPPNIITTE
jgi:hypothetical protein